MSYCWPGIQTPNLFSLTDLALKGGWTVASVIIRYTGPSSLSGKYLAVGYRWAMSINILIVIPRTWKKLNHFFLIIHRNS